MNVCPKCNLQLDEGVKFCTACGEDIVLAETVVVDAEPVIEPTPAPEPEYQTYQAPPQYSINQPGVEPGKNAAIAALVLGIVAVVFSYVALLGLAAGIVGLFMANNAKKESFTGGMMTAGFICALVGTILAGLGTVACISCSCMACMVPTTAPFWYL